MAENARNVAIDAPCIHQHQAPEVINHEVRGQGFRKPERQVLHCYRTAADMVSQLQPCHPVHLYRPHVAKRMTQWFLSAFPGTVMYSVKSNPEPHVLQSLYDGGMRYFDVASLPEIRLIAEMFPDCPMYFMHPVKSREAIASAYHEYGVRDFSLDSFEELHKILSIVGDTPHDLGLYLRLALPKGTAAHDLSGKFGASLDEMHDLLPLVRKIAQRVGVCFHVGSQCMDANAYDTAMKMVADLCSQTNIAIDVLDIGGGFPSIYPELTPQPLAHYMEVIADSYQRHFGHLPQPPALWSEPGRALVAESGSLVARVELRKKDALYINDGTYGTLFDAGHPRMIFPTKLIRRKSIQRTPQDAVELAPFRLFGPTCDSLDAMPGPFMLPADIVEGDWIEFGQLGAYGSTLQTRFNGFYSDHTVIVDDEPIISMFDKTALQRHSAALLAA